MQLANMALTMQAMVLEVNALRQWRLGVPVAPPQRVFPGAGI